MLIAKELLCVPPSYVPYVAATTFSVSAPKIWNTLRTSNNLNVFKYGSKTIFRQFYSLALSHSASDLKPRLKMALYEIVQFTFLQSWHHRKVSTVWPKISLRKANVNAN
jgi:hypothetical protein